MTSPLQNQLPIWTGWRAFDRITGGLQPGSLYEIAGPAKSGKTCVALLLALHAASQDRAACVSGEDNPHLLSSLLWPAMLRVLSTDRQRRLIRLGDDRDLPPGSLLLVDVEYSHGRYADLIRLAHEHQVAVVALRTVNEPFAPAPGEVAPRHSGPIMSPVDAQIAVARDEWHIVVSCSRFRDDALQTIEMRLHRNQELLGQYLAWTRAEGRDD